MAARLNRRHQDSVRAKIQATQLINLLQKEAKGQIELKKGQRESAMFLLDKSISNAPAVVEGAGEDGEHLLEVTWRAE